MICQNAFLKKTYCNPQAGLYWNIRHGIITKVFHILKCHAITALLFFLFLSTALLQPNSHVKKRNRKLFREKRAELTPLQQQKWDDLILIHFQTIELPFLSSVLSFYPIEEKKEINTFTIVDYLHFKNPALQIAYPKTDVGTQTMKAIACTADAAFEINEYGIPEPVEDEALSPGEIDLVLIPLLAFDKEGNRVGYGKGFYDGF